MVPLREVYQLLTDRKYSGWIVVELDSSEDPQLSARKNEHYLRHVLGVKLP